jgi:hypothetical protein
MSRNSTTSNMQRQLATQIMDQSAKNHELYNQRPKLQMTSKEKFFSKINQKFILETCQDFKEVYNKVKVKFDHEHKHKEDNRIK